MPSPPTPARCAARCAATGSSTGPHRGCAEHSRTHSRCRDSGCSSKLLPRCQERCPWLLRLCHSPVPSPSTGTGSCGMEPHPRGPICCSGQCPLPDPHALPAPCPVLGSVTHPTMSWAALSGCAQGYCRGIVRRDLLSPSPTSRPPRLPSWVPSRPPQAHLVYFDFLSIHLLPKGPTGGLWGGGAWN